MSAAWFVDGAFLFKGWGDLQRDDHLDYLALRQGLERNFCDTERGERIEEAYFFNADADPPTAAKTAFHTALQFPPPKGPGLRVKLYWLQHRELHWPAHMGGDCVVHPRTGQPYIQTLQKGVDVGLAFHLIRSYSKRGWKKLFLAAGDGDFHEPIQHLVENEAVDLVLIGTRRSISTELLPYARDVVQLEDIAENIARARMQRPA